MDKGKADHSGEYVACGHTREFRFLEVSLLAASKGISHHTTATNMIWTFFQLPAPYPSCAYVGDSTLEFLYGLHCPESSGPPSVPSPSCRACDPWSPLAMCTPSTQIRMKTILWEGSRKAKTCRKRACQSSEPSKPMKTPLRSSL
eukprot:4639526-Amphidinium_carterae.1